MSFGETLSSAAGEFQIVHEDFLGIKHKIIMLVLGNKTGKIFAVSHRPSEKQMTVTLSDSFGRHRNF